MSTKQKVFDTTVKRLGALKYQFDISTGDVDRENDTISLRGWRLDNYQKNPVVLWAHSYAEPPIARASDVRVVGGALTATVEFPPAGVYDRADTIRALVEQGFIRATSVGFKPIKWKYNAERGGVDFQEQELLEFSLVPVPANPACVVGPSKSLDWRRLDKFLGAPRGVADDFEFDLAAIPARDGRQVDLTRADVVGAMREAIPAMVGAAVRSRLPVLVLDEQILELSDQVEAGLSADDIRSAMVEAISPLVSDAVARRVRIARGRVD